MKLYAVCLLILVILNFLVNIPISSEIFYCNGYAMCPEICYEYMSNPSDPCVTCKCPKGYKRPLYYDLKECKHGKCVKSNETCIHNYCHCSHKFIRVPFLDEPECRPMPRLGDSCFVKGRKSEMIVLPCGITPNIDTECHFNASMERGSCECKKGYQNLNDKNEKCVPVMNYDAGSPCKQDSDCSLAYSHCNSSRQCSCRNGYQLKNASCTWPKKACPFEHGNTGQYRDVKREPCILKSEPDSRAEANNCTFSQFAFCFSDFTVLTPDGYFVGHCCPTPMDGEAAVKLTCQNSEVKADSQCSNPIGRVDEMSQNCPAESHVCADQKYRYDPACCSRPCNVFKAINVFGRCVLPVRLDEPCLYDLQCPLHADCETLNKNYCQGFSYCPDVCIQKFNTYCMECECPDGYESTMRNYTLLTCKNDQECLLGLKPRSIKATCKYGFCQCPKDSLSLPSGNECVKVPSQPSDRCFFHNTYMVDCDETVDFSNKHVAEIMTCNMDKRSKFYGRCTCAPGYYRDQSSLSTCQAKTRGYVGTRCRYHADCTVPYSKCVNQICACRDGFDLAQKFCVPRERYCPGSSMTTPSIGKPCTTYYAHKREYNTCGRNEFCFTDHKTLLENSTRQTPVKVGHCCPIPSPEDDLRLACPFNTIRNAHRCPVKRGTQLELLGTCPMGEYYCLPQKYRSDRACCVNPCSNMKAFVMRNRCLLPVQIGQSCEHSLQCPAHAICRSSASKNDQTCICENGYSWIAKEKRCTL